jgi:hypothetical protein
MKESCVGGGVIPAIFYMASAWPDYPPAIAQELHGLMGWDGMGWEDSFTTLSSHLSSNPVMIRGICCGERT